MRPVKYLLPLSALGALACSIALDFDRQYAGVDEVFPLQDLADLAGTPAGAARETALCGDFCGRYLACLGAACDALEVTGKTSDPDSLAECEASCARMGGPTPSELTYIGQPDGCLQIGQAAVEAFDLADFDPASCDEYETYCEALCEAPTSDDADLTECEDNLDGDECLAFCQTLSKPFFDVMTAQAAAMQPLCSQWAAAKATRDSTDVLDLSTRCDRTCGDLARNDNCGRPLLANALCEDDCAKVPVAGWACLELSRSENQGLCESLATCTGEFGVRVPPGGQ
jgi:hypothetical protein